MNMIAKITSMEEAVLKFNNGLQLVSAHERDCCEYHYADFEALELYNLSPTTGKMIDIMDMEFDLSSSSIIEKVDGLGFKIRATNGDCFLVPCYGYNNGFYSTRLILCLLPSDINTRHIEPDVEPPVTTYMDNHSTDKYNDIIAIRNSLVWEIIDLSDSQEILD